MTTAQNQEARNWNLACHLSGLLCWVGVPFGNIFGPLLVWLLKKEDVPSVDEHGKEALNFQISMTIYFVASILLSVILIGLPLLFIIPVIQVVLVIIASVKVSNGEFYQYPATIRFIS